MSRLDLRSYHYSCNNIDLFFDTYTDYNKLNRFAHLRRLENEANYTRLRDLRTIC